MSSQSPLVPVVSWVYDIILSILSLAVHLFFRDVQVRGAWRVPVSGPVVLVAAPHSNQVGALHDLSAINANHEQFVDSVILMRILRSQSRMVSWLMAEKSFRRKFVGSVAAGIGVVPV